MIKKILTNKDVKVWLGMIVGSVIYCLGVVFVLDLGQFYAGGVTGISQIISNAVQKFVDAEAHPDLYQFAKVGLKSALIVVINAPLFLIGWRGVSKRFAIVSLGSVLLQTALIALFEVIRFNGFDPLIGIADEGHVIVLSIFGGLITGAGCGICLKYGASTGGMDILSQYVSLKKHISFAKFTLIIDIVIIGSAILVSGGLETGIYTIIRMIVHVITLDKIHTIYNHMKVSIVTDNLEEMRTKLLEVSHHGITIYEATGGFSQTKKYVLESVVSSYEEFEINKAARQADPHCFITYTAIKKIDGKFNLRVIA